MSDEMEENIKNNKNTQYFIATTYYATPPNSAQNKIMVILAFNSESFKSILCNLSIISNENKETFFTIFEYLKHR